MAFQETEEEDIGAEDELGWATPPGIAESFVGHSSVTDTRVSVVGRAARIADGEFFEMPRGERHVVLSGFCSVVEQRQRFFGGRVLEEPTLAQAKTYGRSMKIFSSTSSGVSSPTVSRAVRISSRHKKNELLTDSCKDASPSDKGFFAIFCRVSWLQRLFQQGISIVCRKSRAQVALFEQEWQVSTVWLAVSVIEDNK